MRLDLTAAHSVLCLGAHCDDIEIGCGGTMLQLLDANQDAEVWWVVLSGEPARLAEAEASCRAYAGRSSRVRFVAGGFRDRFFPHEGEKLKRFVHELAEEARPDVVFTHRREDLHQDHRTVAELTWNAFRRQLILEYEIPKYEGDLGQPNVFVPLNEEVVDRKISQLCECFPSQREKPWFDAEAFRALLRLRGLECLSPSRYAEAFYGRKLTLT